MKTLIHSLKYAPFTIFPLLNQSAKEVISGNSLTWNVAHNQWGPEISRLPIPNRQYFGDNKVASDQQMGESFICLLAVHTHTRPLETSSLLFSAVRTFSSRTNGKFNFCRC